MKRRRAGVTIIGIVLIVVMLLVLAAILFPIFAQTDTRPRAVVLGADRKPLPNAVLRFRDDTGRVVAVIHTNEHGYFRRKGLRALSRKRIDGFALARYAHATGSGGYYTFSPLGTHEIVLRNAVHGKPVAELAMVLRPDWKTWNVRTDFSRIERVSDANGTVRLSGVPVSARFEFSTVDRRRYVVRNAETSIVNAHTVRHTVAVIAPGTITGRLLAPDGAPVSGWYAFVTTDLRRAAWRSPYAMAVTGREGQFRIVGLLPGVYYVGAKPGKQSVPDTPTYGRPTAPPPRVRVASGQTEMVKVWASGDVSHR